jgi:hypothetical protein
MSSILQKARDKRLINVGYECDVYQIGDRLVYKHYPSCKPNDYGRVRQPWVLLNKIRSDNVERVYDHDEEGFVTDLCAPMGDMLIYKPIHRRQAASAIAELREVTKNFPHHDINPSNLMYNRWHDVVVLIDWTQSMYQPLFNYLRDRIAFKNWEMCVNSKTRRWYPSVTRAMVRLYIGSAICYPSLLKRSFDSASLRRRGQYALKRLSTVYTLTDQHLYRNKIDLTIELLQNLSESWRQNIELQERMIHGSVEPQQHD